MSEAQRSAFCSAGGGGGGGWGGGSRGLGFDLGSLEGGGVGDSYQDSVLCPYEPSQSFFVILIEQIAVSIRLE